MRRFDGGGARGTAGGSWCLVLPVLRMTAVQGGSSLCPPMHLPLPASSPPELALGFHAAVPRLTCTGPWPLASGFHAAAPVCCRVPTLGRRAAAWRTAAAMRTAAAATAAAAPLAMTAATTQVRAAALLVIATGCRLPAFVCWLLLLLLLLVMIFACGLLVSRGRTSAYTAHQMGRASVSASS